MIKEMWHSLLNKIRSSINKQIDTDTSSSTTLAAGRETVDTPYTRYHGETRISAKDKLDHSWNMGFLDENRIRYLKTTDLLEVLMEVSPDFNRALHDFVQFVITKYEVKIHDPDSDPTLRNLPNRNNQTESQIVRNGTAIINDAILTMRDKKERLISKLEKAAASIFLHGAIFSEVVFDLQGRDFSDLVIIDATLVDFKPTEDPVDGETFRLGQVKNGEFIDLQDDPTIDYIAFDAVAGSPIGRSLSSASIFPLIFSLQLLKDMRQVIRTQGYPFKVAKVDRVVLKDSGITDRKEQNKIIDEETAKLKAFLSQPAGPYTKTPIMGSEIDLSVLEGIKGASLSNVETLIQIIERQIIRALKTYSVIFGINSASGLSDNSDIQAELHYIFIDSIQRKVEDWMESVLTQVLRASGNLGVVEFKLDRINTLVQKQRSDIDKTIGESLKIYVDAGAISEQEMRDCLRHPDPFREMAIILQPELPPEAERQPDDLIEVENEDSNNE